MRLIPIMVALLIVAGCSTQPSESNPSNQPRPITTVSRQSDPQGAEWMERFCGVVGDLKTKAQAASNLAAASSPGLKFRMSNMLTVIGNDIPHSMGRLDVLSRSPVAKADELVGSLTGELAAAQRRVEQARRDIDALPSNDEGAVQGIMAPIQPLVNELSTFPLRLVVVDEALRAVGDATPACKGILDRDSPPR